MEPIKQFLAENRIQATNVYAIPNFKFQQLDVKQWKHNRPADMSRVTEIHNWMAQFNRMDGVINLAYIPGDGLVCFEGNHRRLALKSLPNPLTVMVDIVWDATNDIVIHEFSRINKAVTVPEIYISGSDVKVEVQELVKDFIKTYPKMISTNGKPNRPLFNRDRLSDEIYRVHVELDMSISEIKDRLIKLNEKYSTRDDTSKLTPNTYCKCKNSGLWLFAWSSVLSSAEISNT